MLLFRITMTSKIPTQSKHFGQFKDNASRKDSIMDTASFSTGSSGSLWASTCTPVSVPNETRMLALTILDECGKIYHSQRVRHLIHSTFQFMDTNDKWWPPLYGVEMYKALVRAIKPEHRKVFISEMLAYMEATQPNWSSPESVFSSSATCSSVLSSILLDENILIPGLNVVDVMTLIIHVLEIWLSFQATEDVNHHKAVAKHMIKLRLTACISSMALVIYYDQQIPDVVCLLFSMTSNRASLELRQCLVAALKLIMKKNKDALLNSCDGKNTQVRAIPVGYIQPSLSLLLDSDPVIRADFALLLINYMEQISDTNLSDKMQFIHALMRTIEEYGRLEHTLPTDMIALHGLLLTLLKLRNAISFTVGLLLQLRDSCPEGARGILQQTILIQSLQQLAVVAECASFGDLMIQAETKAKEQHQWVDKFGYDSGMSFKRIPANLEDLVSNHNNQATCLPSRQAMLDVLAEHTKFGSDPEWKDLLTSPKTITSSGAELEKFRIKSSRDLKLNIVVSKAIYSDIIMSIDKHVTNVPPRATSRGTFLRQIQSALDTRDIDEFSLLSHAPYDVE
ncbi:hypothetical protein K450DRAFT_256488 [Umbelopsis ramanniana AG]|uniref:Uncharacterized protein n=1 Tax=Umbelopsis ramanniana AG TaxID=1314678 RepID=A0AAD5E556_UMBRA|nr:uncharacterized protein K450DRAFT_256488 [Umbelopsis ramanniana AG]KAI8576506.1 hypothetical protein K450DRAFT_256488 [Umbelopsis ramanniana AG]